MAISKEMTQMNSVKAMFAIGTAEGCWNYEVQLVFWQTAGHSPSTRPSRFLTLATDHLPPSRVSIPRLLSSAAIAQRDAWPAARMSATTGASPRSYQESQHR